MAGGAPEAGQLPGSWGRETPIKGYRLLPGEHPLRTGGRSLKTIRARGQGAVTCGRSPQARPLHVHRQGSYAGPCQTRSGAPLLSPGSCRAGLQETTPIARPSHPGIAMHQAVP